VTQASLLSFLRHGIAESCGDDPPLSEEGIVRMNQQAEGMLRLGLNFPLIYSSPLRRARMTAEIVAERVGPGTRGVVVTDLLEPGCNLARVQRVVEDIDLELAPHVLMVGHTPDLGQIASILIGTTAAISLGRGDLCTLLIGGWPPRPQAVLRWLVPAEIQARLGAEPHP